MEIKILENNNLNCDIFNSNLTPKSGISFKEILNNKITKSIQGESEDNNTEQIKLYKSKGMEAISKLSEKDQKEILCIEQHFRNILGIELFDYFKPDATINFSKIVHDFGDDSISPSNLDQLNKDLETLHKYKLLTDDELNFGIGWITIKAQTQKITFENKEKLFSTYKSLVSSSQNKEHELTLKTK